jgi:glycine/D-amino acid oxidase-like deaminating enzyme
LPLTIDPSGIHMRQYGQTDYMAGSPPHIDPAAAFDDFEEDHSIWEEHVWPLIAARIPQFEAIRVTSSWAGHYAYNVLDHNAVLGPHSQISNFIFANGFSGHGLQQSPAVGRGIAELILYGEYRALDLSSFSYQRIIENRPVLETAII